LAGQFDKTEVLVERGRFGRFGVYNDGSDRQRFSCGSNPLARICQQDGTQACALSLLTDG
jgi:hypothetical protein